jgi:hypothetical protein
MPAACLALFEDLKDKAEPGRKKLEETKTAA